VHEAYGHGFLLKSFSFVRSFVSQTEMVLLMADDDPIPGRTWSIHVGGGRVSRPLIITPVSIMKQRNQQIMIDDAQMT